MPTDDKNAHLEEMDVIHGWRRTVSLPLSEAINWIAFGNFSGGHSGPKPLFHFENVIDHLNERMARGQGRVNLAYEMLLLCLEMKTVPVFGVSIDNENELRNGGKIVDITAKFNGPYDIHTNVSGDIGFGVTLEDETYAFLHVGWNELQAAFPGRLPPGFKDAAPSVEVALKQTSPGRPKKHDWESFLQEVARIANRPDGLPERMAHLEKTMAQWCLETWGKEPSESQIRSKLSPLYRMERDHLTDEA